MSAQQYAFTIIRSRLSATQLWKNSQISIKDLTNSYIYAIILVNIDRKPFATHQMYGTGSVFKAEPFLYPERR